MLIDSELTDKVLSLVREERSRQDDKWGKQHHLNGASPHWTVFADEMKKLNDIDEATDEVSWANVLAEELFEAISEDKDVEKLTTELLQVAAVCVVWLEDLYSPKKEDENG